SPPDARPGPGEPLPRADLQLVQAAGAEQDHPAGVAARAVPARLRRDGRPGEPGIPGEGGQTARATRDGGWDEAEELLAHDMRFGSVVWGGRFRRLVTTFTCRRAQGRVPEMPDELVAAAGEPGLVPLRPVAVLAAAEADRPALARELIGRWGIDMPDNWVGDFLIPVWGLVAARLGTPDPRDLYRRLFRTRARSSSPAWAPPAGAPPTSSWRSRPGGWGTARPPVRTPRRATKRTKRADCAARRREARDSRRLVHHIDPRGEAHGQHQPGEMGRPGTPIAQHGELVAAPRVHRALLRRPHDPVGPEHPGLPHGRPGLGGHRLQLPGRRQRPDLRGPRMAGRRSARPRPQHLRHRGVHDRPRRRLHR